MTKQNDCVYKSNTYPTYNMCSYNHSLFFLLALAVKPTVIDVGIYVNSIGPVSSIDMVSESIHSLSFYCSDTNTHTFVHCPS